MFSWWSYLYDENTCTFKDSLYIGTGPGLLAVLKVDLNYTYLAPVNMEKSYKIYKPIDILYAHKGLKLHAIFYILY